MNDIVFATNNKNKLEEAKYIMKDTAYNIISLDEIGYKFEIAEDGRTYEENVLKKVMALIKYTDKIVFADDSGLEIGYLNKKPGIYSSRFMGKDTSFIVKNKKIIEMLKDAKGVERRAQFVCVVAIVFPNKKKYVIKSVMDGFISEYIKGENGFGYDSIFYVDEFKKNISELSSIEKNQISHRGKALRKMKEILLNI